MFTIAFSFIATTLAPYRHVTFMARATSIQACSVVYQLGCLVYLQVTNLEPTFSIDSTFTGLVVVAKVHPSRLPALASHVA